MSFNDSVNQGIIDFSLLHNIVHGNATDVVTTQGGPVPTVANVIASILSRVLDSLSATSSSIVAIDTNSSKTFTVEANKGFKPGNMLLASAGGSNFILGVVVSYSGTTLIVNPIKASGSGSLSSWNIGMGGPAGADGKDGTGTGGSSTQLLTKLPWE